MRFETTKEDIIEMYNDYRYLKYYHINVVEDIIYNTKDNNNVSDNVIKTMINQQELNKYIAILKKYVDIVYPNTHYGRLVDAYNKEMRKTIEETINLVDITTDDDMIQTYIYELRQQLRRRYLNNDY